MRRSSSIRFLSAVIGETSLTDDNIESRHDHNDPWVSVARRTNCYLTKNKFADEILLKLPLVA